MSTVRQALLLALTFIFLGAGIVAHGQVYSWVDENGKKHFGDRIPPQYQDQAAEYEMKETNSAKAVEHVEYATPTQRPRSSGRSVATSGQFGLSGGSRSSAGGGSCEAQKAAYERAQACWGNCRQFNSSGGRAGINAAHSACKKCQNLSKPKC